MSVAGQWAACPMGLDGRRYVRAVWSEAFEEIEREHPGLITGATQILTQTAESQRTLGSVMFFQYSQRVERLAANLNAAGLLAAEGHPAAAFTVLRTCLEHTCVDQLLFNGSVRQQRYRNVSETWVDEVNALIAAGDPGVSDIRVGSVERRKNDGFVIRAAHPLHDSSGQRVRWVSPYFVALEHHSPFIGKKSAQDDRLQILSPLAEKRELAERNEFWWRDLLTWSAVRANLGLNGFYTDRDLTRLEVHYGFLSAFAHGLDAGYDLVDHGTAQEPCHFCRELVALYIATFAAIEVRSILVHCADELDETFAQALSTAADHAERGSAHLWFPPGEATIWDRHQAVLEMQADSDVFGRPIVEPEDLDESQIRYYSNPLQRLVNLHRSGREMVTGLYYESPWPRADWLHR